MVVIFKEVRLAHPDQDPWLTYPGEEILSKLCTSPPLPPLVDDGLEDDSDREDSVQMSPESKGSPISPMEGSPQDPPNTGQDKGDDEDEDEDKYFQAAIANLEDEDDQVQLADIRILLTPTRMHFSPNPSLSRPRIAWERT